AAFAATYPQLNMLNVMHLHSPASAILSAVIFNALVIVFLINHLLFARSGEITESLHLWPWIFWPLLVGAGGVLAGYFL
ncbi:potassium-transporting ATPase subunit B, partial [Pantoea agglomerans]|nr:potassium-transporting ATPase subunit B [Pantoea agglomerans]